MTARPDNTYARRPATPPWGPGWARLLAGMATLFPLGLAGTGIITMTAAVGSASLQWIGIGLATVLLGAAIAAPLGVFLAKGGKPWFVTGTALVVLLAATLLVFAFL